MKTQTEKWDGRNILTGQQFEAFQSVFGVVINGYAMAVERALVERIEEIEGRVVTNEEVKVHGQCCVYPNRNVWHWRGKKILETRHPQVTTRKFGFTIKKFYPEP